MCIFILVVSSSMYIFATLEIPVQATFRYMRQLRIRELGNSAHHKRQSAKHFARTWDFAVLSLGSNLASIQLLKAAAA